MGLRGGGARLRPDRDGLHSRLRLHGRAQHGGAVRREAGDEHVRPGRGRGAFRVPHKQPGLLPARRGREEVRAVGLPAPPDAEKAGARTPGGVEPRASGAFPPAVRARRGHLRRPSRVRRSAVVFRAARPLLPVLQHRAPALQGRHRPRHSEGRRCEDVPFAAGRKALPRRRYSRRRRDMGLLQLVLEGRRRLAQVPHGGLRRVSQADNQPQLHEFLGPRRALGAGVGCGRQRGHDKPVVLRRAGAYERRRAGGGDVRHGCRTPRSEGLHDDAAHMLPVADVAY